MKYMENKKDIEKEIINQIQTQGKENISKNELDVHIKLLHRKL